MNIFEGSRRIAKVLGCLIFVVAIIGICNQDSTVFLRYDVFPGGQVLDAPDDCKIGEDGIEADDFTTRKGTRFHRVFCFKAMQAENGKMLVPFKTSDGTILLNGPFSDDVKTYTSSYMSNHPPEKKDFDQADSEHQSMIIKRSIYGVVGVLLGAAIYWACIWVVGWIIRGFLGIPRGQDYKILPAQPQ